MAREGAWPEEGLVLRFTQSKVPFRGRLNVGGERYKDLGGRRREEGGGGRGGSGGEALRSHSACSAVVGMRSRQGK